MSTITIIGAGMMGSAMAVPAADNGHQVRLIGTPLDRDIIASVQRNGLHPTLRRPLPGSVTAGQFEELVPALAGADLIICGVSSFGVDWFAAEVLPHLPPASTVLSITKGLAEGAGGSLTAFPDHFAAQLPAAIRETIRFAAVGGPCISFELADRRHTLVNFCGRNADAPEHARKLLATGYYHVRCSTDVVGVEVCAALKNAYAMGVSLAVGLADREAGGLDSEAAAALCVPGAPDRNPIYNPQAALFAQSCLEMSRIVALLGGDAALAGLLPGAGDLYVTIFGGRTRRLGTLLGRGIAFEEARRLLRGVTLEAVAIITRTARAIRLRAERGEADPAAFPLLMHMDAVLNHHAAPAPPWEKFGL